MLRKILILPFIASLLYFGGNFADAQLPAVEKPKSEKDARSPLKKCWDYTFSPGSGRSISSSEDKIYISEANGNVRAISSVTNETLWMTELGGSIEAMLVLPGVGLVTVSNSTAANSPASATLRLLEGNSGLAKYNTSVASGKVSFLKLAGSRVIAFSTTGELEAFDINSGQAVWKTKAGDDLSAEPATFDTTIAVPTRSKKIEFYSLNDGSTTGTIVLDREIKVIGFRENQMLLAGDDRGNVTNFRDQQGTIWWKFKSGARIGTLAETNDGILVGSYDNFVYMIAKYSGDVRWKTRLEGRVVYRPLVVGTEAYFTVSGQDDLVIINLESGKIIEQTSFGSDKFPIADPMVGLRDVKIFPLVGGLQAYTQNGCK